MAEPRIHRRRRLPFRSVALLVVLSLHGRAARTAPARANVALPNSTLSEALAAVARSSPLNYVAVERGVRAEPLALPAGDLDSQVRSVAERYECDVSWWGDIAVLAPRPPSESAFLYQTLGRLMPRSEDELATQDGEVTQLLDEQWERLANEGALDPSLLPSEPRRRVTEWLRARLTARAAAVLEERLKLRCVRSLSLEPPLDRDNPPWRLVLTYSEKDRRPVSVDPEAIHGLWAKRATLNWCVKRWGAPELAPLPVRTGRSLVLTARISLATDGPETLKTLTALLGDQLGITCTNQKCSARLSARIQDAPLWQVLDAVALAAGGWWRPMDESQEYELRRAGSVLESTLAAFDLPARVAILGAARSGLTPVSMQAARFWRSLPEELRQELLAGHSLGAGRLPGESVASLTRCGDAWWALAWVGHCQMIDHPSFAIQKTPDRRTYAVRIKGGGSHGHRSAYGVAGPVGAPITTSLLLIRSPEDSNHRKEKRGV